MATDEGHAAGFRTQTEEIHRQPLSVSGGFPDWLAGEYVANGPGQFEAGDTDLVHWFDPLAMVRRVDFDALTYTNRLVRSRDLEFARESGGVRTPFPGTPPDRPVWTRLRQALTGVFPDNPVIGVQRLDGDLLAVTESPWGLVLDPDTLETVDRVDLAAGLDCDLTLAHAHYDHDRERFLNLGVSYGPETTYTLFERPADGGEPTPLSRLRFDESPYVHSFALTEAYAVVTVNAFGLDPRALLRGTVTGDTFLDAFTAVDAGLRFVVLDRETGRHVHTAETDPAFVYHHANAFEREGEVVIDAVAFPDERAVTGLTLDNLRSDDPALPQGDLVRYRLPLDDGRVERTTLHEGPAEFPMIDYAGRGGREHRYVYLAETEVGSGSSLPTDVAKVDTETGRVRRWRETGTHPGEPVFVPAPDGDREDDGVLLTVLLDPGAGRSVLVCLDATTLSERGRAPLPHRLPYGFHGQYYGPASPGRSMP